MLRGLLVSRGLMELQVLRGLQVDKGQRELQELLAELVLQVQQE